VDEVIRESGDDRTPFSLARRLRQGETARVGWSFIPSPQLAGAMAREGLMGVVIDQQHGLWDTTSTFPGIAALVQGGAAACVRIGVGDFAGAARAIDYGATVIIAPMIETVADAEALVAATKYPPVGLRSWGPIGAMALSGVTDANAYLRAGNQESFVFVMIETATALANVEAIAATPGIDGLFLGPYDLSVALSRGAEVNPYTPAVAAVLDRVLAAAKAAGKCPGIYCSNIEQMRTAQAKGFRFVTVGADADFLHAGISTRLAELAQG
jgi:4-hydroxy-2-oxoheptanedioate aldolase